MACAIQILTASASSLPQQQTKASTITIGGSTWKTSIFPDAGRGCYVLPLKRAVREAETLDTGDIATVTVRVLDL